MRGSREVQCRAARCGQRESASARDAVLLQSLATTGIPKTHENKVAPLRRLIARMGPEAAPDPFALQASPSRR